jgi:hypothetical protein
MFHSDPVTEDPGLDSVESLMRWSGLSRARPVLKGEEFSLPNHGVEQECQGPSGDFVIVVTTKLAECLFLPVPATGPMCVSPHFRPIVGPHLLSLHGIDEWERLFRFCRGAFGKATDFQNRFGLAVTVRCCAPGSRARPG